MKRIKMWFLKVFFPKKYYEELGKESAKRIKESCDQLKITMEAFTKAINNYTERNYKK